MPINYRYISALGKTLWKRSFSITVNFGWWILKIQYLKFINEQKLFWTLKFYFWISLFRTMNFDHWISCFSINEFQRMNFLLFKQWISNNEFPSFKQWISKNEFSSFKQWISMKFNEFTFFQCFTWERRHFWQKMRRKCVWEYFHLHVIRSL